MLRNLFKGVIRRAKKIEANSTVGVDEYLVKAHELWALGDIRAALKVYQEAQDKYPDVVDVLNGLGVCHGALGNNSEANRWFERAYLIDDTHLPTVVNRARVYVDERKSAEALPLLRHAWCQANEGGTDDVLYAIYASLCLNNGDIVRAVHFQSKARLSDFDSLRTANGFLFKSAYADVDEERLASEHVFWAETLKPLEIACSGVKTHSPENDRRRIKIGYWSPDLRNHSVRYFLRPLLENHDRSRFEVYVYHDNHAQDHQTELMRDVVDHFYDVYELSDQVLHDLIRDHELDVLVELAGHTSANRLPLLQHRMASVQLTALGYPPTTGLAEVDGKVLDEYTFTEDASRFYSEEPIILPGSFWCFDPMEDVPVALTPPSREKGFVTFGCIGNVAKINSRMLRCWQSILARVPTSRLLIRSISFLDAASINFMKGMLEQVGIDLQRVDLLPPLGGMDLFKSYSEIDVVLDTYPFNGGTTTCFATYMGVPVVTLYGQSLISRMGLSILTNLEAKEWAVPTELEYVETAVALAHDLLALERFRSGVRERYQRSPLGNGKLYAGNFESACVELLVKKASRTTPYTHSVPPLAESETLRRAYKVLGAGNIPAARRILEYSKLHHGNSGPARMLEANLQYADSGILAAIDSIERALGQLTGSDRSAGLIMLTQWLLQTNRVEEAQKYVRQLLPDQIDDPFDRMQSLVFHAAFATDLAVAANRKLRLSGRARNVKLLIPCDSESRFDEMKSNLAARCANPHGWNIHFQRCQQQSRHLAYKQVMREGYDIVVVMQRHVDIGNEDFFAKLDDAFGVSDVVGIAGAKVWSQLDWRRAEDSHKAGGFVMMTRRDDLMAEIRYLGVDRSRFVGDMTVLDGSLFALNMSSIQVVDFNDELADAEWLMEEDWLFRLGHSGARLSVDRTLGAILHPLAEESRSAAATSKMHWLDTNHIDPFVPKNHNAMFVSVLVKDPDVGCKVLENVTH